MSNQTSSQNSDSPSLKATKLDGHKDMQPEDPQPESGFVDREERMEIRQSSPTNPRVNDKPEMNQEEA